MTKPIPISIYEVVGTQYCVATGDGEKVYSRLALALRHNRRVSLSFRNVSLLTSAFLNAAIGQLYGKFDEERIHDSIEFEEIEPDDAELLELVEDNAKKYFEDPERAEQLVRQVLDGDL